MEGFVKFLLVNKQGNSQKKKKKSCEILSEGESLTLYDSEHRIWHKKWKKTF